MTIFLVIVISNWIGLIPGVGSVGYFEHRKARGARFHREWLIMTAEAAPARKGSSWCRSCAAPSTDLNFTVALALVAVVLAQYFGVKAQKLATSRSSLT